MHWVIYDLPSDWRSSPKLSDSDMPSASVFQSGNDFRKLGYNGPSPRGSRVGASLLFQALCARRADQSQTRATKLQVLEAIKGHVLGAAELMGRYKR